MLKERGLKERGQATFLHIRYNIFTMVSISYRARNGDGDELVDFLIDEEKR
jgi:hypothetical protein